MISDLIRFRKGDRTQFFIVAVRNRAAFGAKERIKTLNNLCLPSKVPVFYCLMTKFKSLNFYQKFLSLKYFDQSLPNSSRFVQNHEKFFL